MSQDIWTAINPTVTSGTTLATILNAFKNSIMSGFSGTSRPPNLQAGGFWIDTTNSLTPDFYYSFKIWSGTVDIEIFRINVNSNFGGIVTVFSDFTVTQISADTTAAIFGLIKQRITSNGQVADGDVVADIQLVGRTDTSTNPIVANIKWTSSDAETSTVFGGYLSFYSTPDASATLTEHLRLISGLVESVVPHKMNSLRLVGQNVATSATIAQLSATKVLVEFTGSTATSLQGINSGQATQKIILHNRSSAVVTLKHQDAGATAADRFKLPNSVDLVLKPDNSLTLFYNITDARWKLESIQRFNSATKTSKTFKGLINDWVCPAGISSVLATPYKRRQFMAPNHKTFIDPYGNLYAWGGNLTGACGDGTILNRSSPVAVLGSGRIYTQLPNGSAQQIGSEVPGISHHGLALDNTGSAYAWGLNANGQLGVGDVAVRSSPVAVLGGLKFSYLMVQSLASFGITAGGVAYAWGKPPQYTISTTASPVVASSPVAVLGGLKFDSLYWAGDGSGSFESMAGLDVNGNAYSWGVGSFTTGGGGTGVSVANISSPTAVVGGLTFKKILMSTNGMLGLTKDGLAYAWGANSFGQLGVGDRVSRSSPVAVLGGFTFSDIYLPSLYSASLNFGLATLDDGTLYSWGWNASGQLGAGDVTNRSSPVAVLGGFKFKEVVANGNSCWGITLDGVMYSWGLNTDGELGVGDVIDRSSPVAVLGGIKWSQFVCNGVHEGQTPTAIAEDGTMYSWGTSGFDTSGTNYGIQGTGTVGTKYSSPIAVVGGFSFDNRSMGSTISIPVTTGNTYRIYIPSGSREARFGNIPLGYGLEKVSIEYDTF